MGVQTLILYIVLGAAGLTIFTTLAAAIFTVEQRTGTIVQRLGRFLREAGLPVKALQGRGIADLRQTIVAVPRDSVDEFRKSVAGTTAKDIMNLILMTQHFDMRQEIGASSRTNAILVSHSPGNLTTLTEQMRDAMFEADQTVHVSHATVRPLPASTAATAASAGPPAPKRNA